jgi:hypothetical protein
VWHDRTGQFRVEAAFLGFNNGKLRLHKVNGVIVEVPAERMSSEDLRYVEKMTQRQSRAPQTSKRISEDDVPLAIQHPKANKDRAPPKKGPQVDWFDFFLEAGCDPDDCTRYASAFDRDKIDEAVLPEINEETMRRLGLREGDIIRTRKHVEKKFPKPKPQPTTSEPRKSSGPAPNLFSAPDGSLKANAPRRGRPSPKGSLPTAVDMNAISAVPDHVASTGSPLAASPAALSPVQAPPRGSSTQANGFEDDAWTNRPSSTKPVATSPSPAPARAPSAPLPSAAPPAPTPPPAPALSATTTTSAPPAQVIATPSTGSLANVTDADIFAQLARLGQLKTASPAPSPAASVSPPVASPPIGFQNGLGMGSSPAPIGQHLQQQQQSQQQAQQNMLQSPGQPAYNGPRGPFAPVPSNQSLLQPLVPTQTGFSGFVPTRPSPQMTSPFQGGQPAGFSPSPQPMMSQPTGAFGTFGNSSPFNSTPILSTSMLSSSSSVTSLTVTRPYRLQPIIRQQQRWFQSSTT